MGKELSIEQLEQLQKVVARLMPSEDRFRYLIVDLHKKAIALFGNDRLLESAVYGGNVVTGVRIHTLLTTARDMGLDAATIVDCVVRFMRAFFSEENADITFSVGSDTDGTIAELRRASEIYFGIGSTMKSSSRSRIFCCIDRHDHVYEIGKRYADRLKTANKILLICPGHNREMHQFLVNRLVDIELPALLRTDDTSEHDAVDLQVQRVDVKIPEAHIAPSSPEFVESLRKQVTSKLGAPAAEVLKHAPVMVVMFLKDNNALGIVEMVLKHWNNFTAPEGNYPFIVCLCLQSQVSLARHKEPEWRWPLSFDQEQALCALALPALPSITQEHLLDWATEIFPDDAALIEAKVGSIYQEHYDKKGEETIMLGDLVPLLEREVAGYPVKRPRARLTGGSFC